MASNVLPQALIAIPRGANHSAPRKLGFSALAAGSSGHCRTYPRHGCLLSRVSFGSRGLSSPVIAAFSKRSFVVRAEPEPEAEVASSESAEENAEAAADVKEAAEAVAEEEVVEVKPPSKPRVKLGDIMGILNKRAVEASENERPVPDVRTGDIVEIKLEVPENRRRLSIYKGIVISRQNAGIHTTIRIRRIIAGIGVEIVFPLYSPNIKEIKVVKHRKVRRARLYYLRDKLPRLSTFK
ncbi:50S ribosomal protein L19-1, chloroplastic [Rhodamnia argentea]|uniref:50S ribosomal protein L19-1, chloroplastic n=1 Tax=Rhodamnia argentea TaxID=178133 RepID=A0A8B8NRI9_9MYRT|nr:50S ribosomal protein L19-1, chloroplastic [Rhodamnia argentea]